MNLQHTLNELFGGAQCVRRASLLIAVATLVLAGTASAQLNPIGLKMGVNGLGGLQNTSTNITLAPTDLAGAPTFEQVNWNLLGRYGDNATNSFGTNGFPIVDSAGADTRVSIMWDATGNWSQLNGGTPLPQGTPDANLMNGYCDSGGGANVALTNNTSIYGQSNNNKPLVFVEGLKAWMTAEGANYYDVVIYVDGDATAGRTGEYWIAGAAMGDTSGPLTNIIFGATDLTTHEFVVDRANYLTTLTYTEVPLENLTGFGAVFGNTPGNYVVLPSLNADSFVLRTEEWQPPGGTRRSPINAIQIVPRTAAVAPALAPLQPSSVYAGGTARFVAKAGGVVPIGYQWQKGGAPLTDGGNISGSATATLTITGVGAGDVANYTVVVTNANGTASASAALSLASYVSGSYPEKIATNNPVAYWRLNDTGDPSTNHTVALDYVGGLNGTYGLAALNGYNSIAGPLPPGFPGFEAGNFALQSANGVIRSWVMAPPLNLNTNTATICAWIYPTAFTEPANTGIIMSRNTGSSDINGLIYAAPGGNLLGYVWNNNASTYNFNSGLVVPSNTWSFVAVAITPTNATVYLYNTNAQLQAVNNVTNAVMPFAGPTAIGDDTSSINTPQGRAFTGLIDEVAVFNRAVPQEELFNMYKKGLGLSYLPAIVSQQPVPLTIYSGRTAVFKVVASGDPLIRYRWQKGTTDLQDGGNISGAATPTLTISNVSALDQDSYRCVVANQQQATSSSAALTVIAAPATPAPYEAAMAALNPLHYWRFNEPSGSLFAYDYYGGNIATNDNALPGAVGPQPPDFPGFETTNTANSFDGLTSATESQLVGLNNNLTKFTIAGWFNAPGPIGLRIGLFGQNDVTEYGFHGQDPNAPTGQGQLGIWTPGGGAVYLSQTNIVPLQWYFTAAVGDGNSLSLYLFSTNGGGGAQVLQSTVVSPTTNYGVSPYSFNIGGNGVMDPTGNFFTGTIDEVGLWRRALSVGELSSLFAAGIGVSALPPQITSEPVGATLYAGRTATLSVGVVGSAPLYYQWLKNDAAITDTNATGTGAATLIITNINAANVGTYKLLITNSVGSVTSSNAVLGVITPPTGGFEAKLLSFNPLAYYRLNETADPASGTAVDNDYWGGNSGLYAVGASNGFNGVAGPRPPGFTFESTNYALKVTTNVLSSWATAPFGSLSTNTVTMCMWVMPTGTFDDYAGLLMNRNAGVAGGFGYTGGQVGYTWNNNNAATYNFRSGFIPPLNVWSFVAVVVSPTNAIVYMFNTNAQLSATNVLNHTSDVFGNNWRIGRDDNANANDATRNFCGVIDEVAVFTHCLTGEQLRQLYVAGAGAVPNTLSYQRSGANVILTWPYGILYQASAVTGPWAAVPGNPSLTYTVPASTTMMFYRVKVN